MHTQPYLVDRLHSVREHDMLEAARRARLVRALEVASATESRPSIWARARHQLSRFAPHHQVPRRRTMPAWMRTGLGIVCPPGVTPPSFGRGRVWVRPTVSQA
jgi:hypothetical protein